MNNKMAISTYLLTIQPRKQTKQTRTENHGYGECFDGCQLEGGCGGNGCTSEGVRKYRYLQSSRRDLECTG